MEPVLVQSPVNRAIGIGVQKDYTIVGIYTAPEFSSGLHSFQADTIFDSQGVCSQCFRI